MGKNMRGIWLAALAALALLIVTAAVLRPAAAKTVPAAAEAAPSAEPVSEPVAMEYEDLLFDVSRVHTLDILVDDDAWELFLQTCTDKEYIACDVVIDGETYRNVALRAKGNSSLQRSRLTGKYSFKVEFDHFAESLSYHGLDKLGLNNLVADDSCLRDYIVYRMMDGFGVPSPLCSYVFVTVNGSDWGFYLAVEGLEDAFLARNYGEGHGALYKPDNLNNGGMARGGMGGSDDVKLVYTGDDPAGYPNIFESAKTDITRQDKYRLIDSLRKLGEQEDIPSVVDIDEMLRYLVVHTFVANGDSYTGMSVHNYYLYEENGRLAMLPWDYNEAFGDFGSSGMASAVNEPIDSPVTSGTLEQRPMVAWVFSAPMYTAAYHALYRMFLAEFADSGWIADEIAAARELIGPYVQRDPRSFCTYDAFLTGTEQLQTFFELRAQSVAGQLDGTIPSTSEGQAADRSALIDASELGTASGGMGGFPGGGMPMPSREPSGEASDATDGTE